MSTTPSPLSGPALESLRRQVAPLTQGVEEMKRTMAAFAPQMAPALSRFAEAAKPIHDAMHAKYLEAGAPYGETHEGFMRWQDEVGEALRLQHEAADILQRHQDLAEMRRLGAELRERRERAAVESE